MGFGGRNGRPGEGGCSELPGSWDCNAGDLSFLPGSGRSPGEGNNYPLQCSCLGNPMDRDAWWEYFKLMKLLVLILLLF